MVEVCGAGVVEARWWWWLSGGLGGSQHSMAPGVWRWGSTEQPTGTPTPGTPERARHTLLLWAEGDEGRRGEGFSVASRHAFPFLSSFIYSEIV